MSWLIVIKRKVRIMQSPLYCSGISEPMDYSSAAYLVHSNNEQLFRIEILQEAKSTGGIPIYEHVFLKRILRNLRIIMSSHIIIMNHK